MGRSKFQSQDQFQEIPISQVRRLQEKELQILLRPFLITFSGILNVYDEDSGEIVSTNPSFFKLSMYSSCTPHQTAARLA